jgi:hypothetical protein
MPRAHYLHICPEAGDEAVSWLEMKLQVKLFWLLMK